MPPKKILCLTACEIYVIVYLEMLCAGGKYMLVLKIICLIICAALLFVCYRPRQFADKILKREDVNDGLILKIKAVSLVISVVIFVLTIIFIR